MLKILLILGIIALYLYAILHWIYNSRHLSPGGINRFIWLFLILVLPFFGSLAWIISYYTVSFEERIYGRNERSKLGSKAPDDNIDWLNQISYRNRMRRSNKNKPKREEKNQEEVGKKSLEQDQTTEDLGKEQAQKEEGGKKNQDSTTDSTGDTGSYLDSKPRTTPEHTENTSKGSNKTSDSKDPDGANDLKEHNQVRDEAVESLLQDLEQFLGKQKANHGLDRKPNEDSDEDSGEDPDETQPGR